MDTSSFESSLEYIFEDPSVLKVFLLINQIIIQLIYKCSKWLLNRPTKLSRLKLILIKCIAFARHTILNCSGRQAGKFGTRISASFEADVEHIFEDPSELKVIISINQSIYEANKSINHSTGKAAR